VSMAPNGSAATVVAEAGAAEVRHVVEPAPGIAAVRNRAMDEAAGARLLVMIDDDERPLAAWLSDGGVLDHLVAEVEVHRAQGAPELDCPRRDGRDGPRADRDGAGGLH